MENAEWKKAATTLTDKVRFHDRNRRFRTINDKKYELYKAKVQQNVEDTKRRNEWLEATRRKKKLQA